MTLPALQNIQRFADSPVIFKRGELLQKNGAFRRMSEECAGARHVYEVDGNFGNYRTEVVLGEAISARCTCPYPGDGCKHAVAILLELLDNGGAGGREETVSAYPADEMSDFLSPAEIRQQALADREQRARREDFKLTRGEMLKGDHLVLTAKGKNYQVTLHDPLRGTGHCSCPDFRHNRLGTCKHLIFLREFLKAEKNFTVRLARETFPYVDIFWDSEAARPRLFHELDEIRLGPELSGLLAELFAPDGLLRREEPVGFIEHLPRLLAHKLVRVQEPVLDKLTRLAMDRELAQAAATAPPLARCLKVEPYPYQLEGIRFGLYRRAVLIGDEMGLGKTLQAIALAILKKEIFGFHKVLIITLSSLKAQWQREIARFTGEEALIIAGPVKKRKEAYRDPALFKITNYEAVLRDVTIISRMKPDLIILDEAQRIKNFVTKTAEAVKSLPRQHAIVLTGTPLENKLEDVYSLIQFLDPELLSPLWSFAADHFLLSRRKKGEILGYTNLDRLREKIRNLVIRRRKEEVLDQLPELVVNDYYVDLCWEQAEMHAGFSQLLMPLISKKFLTPMDMQRIQMLLLKMRQSCDSTYLIDKETNLSPKLAELATILDELVLSGGRKVVIFSEWRTMTMLIGKHLSRAAIPFVELSGKVPVDKRQPLIDEFTNNPDCKVFLSTDAGGTGLNLQAADCVINFELPWNPAKLNQRIGRVNRIGQKSRCVNVVNLIAKNSIEERVMAGIKLKADLFGGVFDGGSDQVLLSREKRQEMVNLLRQMLGDEQELIRPEATPAEELADDTPHYLNPEVLGKTPASVEFTVEEDDPAEKPQEDRRVTASAREPLAAEPAESSRQSAEKMEQVLNQGMGFISGLLEMALGRKLTPAEGSEKLVTLDRETGEVTLKFTLPGFAGKRE